MIYTSPFPAVERVSTSLPAFVFERVQRHADKPAIIDGTTGTQLTYGELHTAIRRTAAGLRARGFGRGDVCALYSPNMPEYAVAFYAAIMAGGVITTVNPLYSVTELTHQLQDSGAIILVTVPKLMANARQAARRAHVREVFVMGDVRGVPSLETLQDSGSPDGLDPGDRQVAVLPYSSGTTGLPKGVMLSHRNITTNIRQIEAVERLDASEVLIAALPFYHIYGMAMVLHQGLRAGATLVTVPTFRTKLFLDIIQRYRVTTAYLVPPLVRMLATHPRIAAYDLSSLRDVVSAAAPLPEATARGCADRVGCDVRQVYGLTEASPATHICPRGSGRPDTVGVAVPGTEFRIVDVGRRDDVRAGGLGEVWVRGPQVMQGYLHDPDATHAMIDAQGWLHTGDIGSSSEDGYLSVVDRAKELVKFRGLHFGEKELLRSMVEEISARRDARKRIESQALLLDSVRESVLATDERNRVTFWNRGAEALFGYTSDEALGQRVDRLILPIDAQVRAHYDVELSHVEAHGRWQGHALRRRRDGSLVWTDVIVSRVTGASDGTSGFIALHRDITELRRNQDMLQESRAQLRNLASRLMDVRENERSAIARELHDELGQALTRLKIDLRWLAGQPLSGAPVARLDAMAGLVDSMVRTVQHISSQLRPSILDDLGLEAAIEAHVHDFAGRSGGACALDLDLGDLKPDRPRDIAVFRIVQEALTNVLRHARAASVKVRARLVHNELQVTVSDDGVGIPADKWSRPQSLGLVGMLERAESVGGRLEVVGRPGAGTTVRLTIPLAPPPDGDRTSMRLTGALG